jgi:hypothetical protein
MRKLMVVAWLCAACSGSNPVSFDDFAEQSKRSACEFQVRCGLIKDDLTACLSGNTAGRTRVSATEQAAVKAGRIKYDGDQARTCLDALSSRSCDVTTASYRGYPEACLSALRGTSHSGAPCADSAECISQSCEIPACGMACCTGTCRGDDAPIVAKIGASCATNLCDQDAFCDPASMMCVVLKRLGESCEDGFSCADGLYCLPSSNTCGSLPGPGERCDRDGCRERGQHCSTTTKTCVNVGLLDDPCSSGEDCSPFYVCGANRQCSEGIALGAPCTRSDRCAGAELAFCDIPDNATMGTCTMPKPDGASCHVEYECVSGVCDPISKTCVADQVCD